MLRRCFLLSTLVAVIAACGPSPQSASPGASPERITVLAAASLTEALTAIGAAYQAQGGAEVQFSFASSSVLARQIEAGAPADLFVSADLQWMDYLAERDLIDPASRTEPIGNSVVLVAPADSPLQPVRVDAGLDLAALLGPEGRIAVGDPEHVPAGRYARDALVALGLWDAAEPRLARTDNVRAALALVERGETPLGIVYATDAAVAAVKVLGTFPEDTHEPVVYPFALLGDAPSAAARAFLDFAVGADGLAILESHGFSRR